MHWNNMMCIKIIYYTNEWSCTSTHPRAFFARKWLQLLWMGTWFWNESKINNVGVCKILGTQHSSLQTTVVLGTQHSSLQSAVICPRMGTNGGFMWMQQRRFLFHTKQTFRSTADPQDYHHDCQTGQFIPSLLQNWFQFSHMFRSQSAAIFSTVHSLNPCTPNSQIWDLRSTVIWRDVL